MLPCDISNPMRLTAAAFVPITNPTNTARAYGFSVRLSYPSPKSIFRQHVNGIINNIPLLIIQVQISIFIYLIVLEQCSFFKTDVINHLF